MTDVRVKICGITSLEDLRIAVEAGADAVGFIVGVPESPRNLSFDAARKMINAVPVFVDPVVVTASEDLRLLREISRALNPRIVQVHGSACMHEEVREIFPDSQVIGGLQAKNDGVIKLAKEFRDRFDAVLLDSYVPGRPGGTGKTHDWMLSRRVRDIVYPKPFILAGGLNPKNIKSAIRTVRQRENHRVHQKREGG
jgi:phosphoribosylanthranilate isomerase